MVSARGYRLIEGGLVSLFFLEGARAVFGVLLGMTTAAISSRQVTLLILNSHLILAAALVVPWFAPRGRSMLPRTLLVSAVMGAVAHIFVSVEIPFIRLAAGAAVIGFSGVYLASLLRANWRTWVYSLNLGLVLDQLLRAPDSYDLALRSSIRLPVGNSGLSIPGVAPQLLLLALLVAVSWLARRAARTEPYEPAYLDVWGGLALGGVFALELLVLGLPGVIARWTDLSYAAVVPWILLATALPLLWSVRSSVSQFLTLFDERLRGWILVLVISLALIAGNRLGTAIGAAAIVIAQFLIVMLIWWIPGSHDPLEVEQVGPSMCLALLTLTSAVYLYELSYEYASLLSWLHGQNLMVVLVAVVLAAFPRLWWREHDPWHAEPSSYQALPAAFIAVVVVMGTVASTVNALPANVPAMNTVRVATYNINHGYDEANTFQLELVARTIEASQADIIVLQETDAGRPVDFGIDETEYLARRLQMYQAYQWGADKLLGVAILSRWPVADVGRAILPDALSPAGAVRAHIVDKGTGHEVTVVGTQFSSTTEQARIHQLAVLFGLIGDTSPMVIGVDTEAPPQEVVYQQLTAGGLLDPDVSLGVERGYTFPASDPVVRRDYLFIRGLVPLASRQVDRSGSLHRLVVIEAGWP